MTKAGVVMALIILAAFPSLALAQEGEGNCLEDPLYPCGPLPWPLPQYPAILSPTPYTPNPSPTLYDITNTPTPEETDTPTPTVTPIPTAQAHETEHSDLATLAAQSGDAISTLDYSDVTLQVQDTPMAAGTVVAQMSGYVGSFVGYAKGLTLFNIKGLGGVVLFLILALVFVFFVIFLTSVVPLIGAMARWVIRVGQLIGEFLPF